MALALFKQRDSGLMALASHIVHEDSRSGRDDEITKHLTAYVETHLLDMIFETIEEESDFPGEKDAEDFEKTDLPPHHRPSDEEVEGQKAAWEDWKRVRTYVKGIEIKQPPRELIMKAMKVGKEGLTPEELALLQPPKAELPEESEVLELLKKHLYKDDKRISGQQLFYELFRGMSDHTQKLQVSAYLIGRMRLQCSRGAARILNLMAQLAPVKTIRNLSCCHRSSHRGEFLNAELGEADFEENLEKLNFSKAGIWAWKLERVHDDEEKEAAYRTCMEMFMEKEDGEDTSLFGRIHEKNKAALKEGLQLLPQRTRLRFYKDLYRDYPDFGFESGREEFYNSFRLLLERNLLSPERLFLNQVRENGLVYSGNEITKYPEYEELKTGMIIHCTEEEALAIAEKNDDHFRDYYLIVQKTNDGYKALANDWIGKMLAIEANEGTYFYFNRTRLVVVSESCDPALIEALQLNLGNENHREEMIEAALGYIRGETEFSSVAHIVPHAIDYFHDIEGENYYECGVTDCIWHLDEAMRLRTLKFMTAACAKGFEAGMDRYDGEFSDYIAYVMQVEPPVEHLFEYILKAEDAGEFVKLSKKHDLYPLINRLPSEARLNALKMLEEAPSESSLVRRFVKDSSRKIRDLVGRVKGSFKEEKTEEKTKDSDSTQAEEKSTGSASTKVEVITCDFLKSEENKTGSGFTKEEAEEEKPGESDFKPVDFGTYAMDGTMGEATSEGASVTASGPRLLEENPLIKAKPGVVFGFRFTSHNEALPKVCNHVVRVIHPELDGPQGMITESSWKQNGYTLGRIFAGWAFESEEECVSGEWTIEILSEDRSTCLVSKTFHVVRDISSVPEIMVRVMKEGTSSPHIGEVERIGKVHVSSGRVVACDPMSLDSAPALNQPVPAGSHPVLLYLDEETESVAYAELKVSNEPVASWHPAPLEDTGKQPSNASSFTVETGMACFMDKESRSVFQAHARKMKESDEISDYFDDYLAEEFYENENGSGEGCMVQPSPDKAANMALFATGLGDGVYSCYCGYNVEGGLVSFVIDCDILDDDAVDD